MSAIAEIIWPPKLLRSYIVSMPQIVRKKDKLLRVGEKTVPLVVWP